MQYYKLVDGEIQPTTDENDLSTRFTEEVAKKYHPLEWDVFLTKRTRLDRLQDSLKVIKEGVKKQEEPQLDNRKVLWLCQVCDKTYEVVSQLQSHYHLTGHNIISGETNELLQSCHYTFIACKDILHRKNHDYAGLGNPWANFEAIEHRGICKTEMGILIRLEDKLQRISNLMQIKNMITDETIDDTILDAINYLAILKARLEYNRSKAE